MVCLFQMAAVVCISFLMAWTPYATVSLMSALIPRDDQEASLQTAVEETTNIPSLLNWTATEYYRQISYSTDNKWSDVSNMNSASIIGLSDALLRSTLDSEAELMTTSPQLLSCFPPVVTLIPAMFAKSHCMINPLIYQIMNREFRDDVCVMVLGQEKAERRRMQGRKGSSYERKDQEQTATLIWKNSPSVESLFLSPLLKGPSASPTATVGRGKVASPCP